MTIERAMVFGHPVRSLAAVTLLPEQMERLCTVITDTQDVTVQGLVFGFALDPSCRFGKGSL